MSMSSNEQKSVKERFSQVYEVLKSEILQDSVFEYDSASRKWIQEMLDYNVPGGKLGRGVALIETLSLLKQTKLNEQDLFLASVLGWCIQWFVACALILDDIMDASYSRRGKTCWYRLPNVGNIAINDGALLWNHIYRFLRYHFRELPYYVHLIELFNECMFQTASGQMIDLISTRDDFSNFTPQLHHRISKFKTAYGTFYLPFACALLMLGEDLDEYIQVKEILVDMGVYFQVQDDYLDSYGNPETVGKIGTDIQDFKCSWLAVKALELCNEDQKKVFCENYGKADEASVGKVKALYNELNLEGVFADYEMEVHEKLTERIQAVPSKAVQSVLKGYLSKIYKRKK